MKDSTHVKTPGSAPAGHLRRLHQEEDGLATAEYGIVMLAA